ALWAVAPSALRLLEAAVLRCPACPGCPDCSCPAVSCSLTCAGPASTSQITLRERDWIGLATAFVSGVVVLRVWDCLKATRTRQQGDKPAGDRGITINYVERQSPAIAILDRSLDIKEFQVLVEFLGDADGLYWHMRVLLARAGRAGAWVTLTPTLGLYTHDLDTIRRIALARNAPWPDRVNRNEIFGFDPISRVELNQYVQLANVQARVLADDDGDPEAPEMLWLRAGPGLDRIGEVIPQEVIDDQERFADT
ncbi:unnamed protein product, partial [Prorocentrum cordatum]